MIRQDAHLQLGRIGRGEDMRSCAAHELALGVVGLRDKGTRFKLNEEGGEDEIWGDMDEEIEKDSPPRRYRPMLLEDRRRGHLQLQHVTLASELHGSDR